MEPFEEGRAAWQADDKLIDCPYHDGTDEAAEWCNGWKQEKKDNARFGVGA